MVPTLFMARYIQDSHKYKHKKTFQKQTNKKQYYVADTTGAFLRVTLIDKTASLFMVTLYVNNTRFLSNI